MLLFSHLRAKLIIIFYLTYALVRKIGNIMMHSLQNAMQI